MTTLINERRTAKGTISMAEIFPNSVVEQDDTPMMHKKWADCFEIRDDINSRIVKKHIPINQCYIKSGMKDVPYEDLRPWHYRPVSTEVWNERCKSSRNTSIRCFKTNWEIIEMERKLQYEKDHPIEPSRTLDEFFYA